MNKPLIQFYQYFYMEMLHLQVKVWSLKLSHFHY